MAAVPDGCRYPEKWQQVITNSATLKRVGQKALLLGARVGTTNRPILPGSELRDCSICGRAVWVTGSIVRTMERRGLVVSAACSRHATPDITDRA